MFFHTPKNDDSIERVAEKRVAELVELALETAEKVRKTTSVFAGSLGMKEGVPQEHVENYKTVETGLKNSIPKLDRLNESVHEVSDLSSPQEESHSYKS